MFTRHYSVLLLLFCSFHPVFTQNIPEKQQDLIESLLQDLEGEGEFDFNTIFENLRYYQNNPLNLNVASEAELRELNFLSDIQISDLLQHRNETGAFISLLELQTIDSFSENLIRALLPFVSIDKAVDDYQLSFPEMLQKGQNELFLRWQRNLQASRGFSDEVNENSRFLGDRNRLYLRYQHRYENKLSYGITAEKDPGEAFFKAPNQAGFDFYSVHLFLRKYNKNIKAIAIGDYAITLGQGVMMHTGFGYGKSNLVMNVKKSTRKLRPYRSVNEVGFLRGAAATIALNKNLEFTAFGSYRAKDGNVITNNLVPEIEGEILGFTSILSSGFHRNANEVADKNAIRQLTTGGNITYQNSNLRIGLNGSYDRFDQPLNRNMLPYNIFYFNGQQNYNLSVDYNLNLRNFNFFGETAVSQSGGTATLNGMLVGLDRKIDLAVLYRNYAPDYVALNANAFGETTGVRNESGLYLGLMIRPSRNWEWSGYFDTYQHPWLRSQADAPSRGYDWRTRLRYFKKRDLDAFVQVRYEAKEVNTPLNTTPTDFISSTELFQTRFQLSKKMNESLELRTALDYGFTRNKASNIFGQGVVFLQDVIYKPKDTDWSFSTRYAIFDTDGYAIRFYYFERALTNIFSIPAYYDQGTRFYLNTQYKGIRNLTLEMRYEQTQWRNRESSGSGLNEIEGGLRSSIWGQLIYRF